MIKFQQQFNEIKLYSITSNILQTKSPILNENQFNLFSLSIFEQQTIVRNCSSRRNLNFAQEIAFIPYIYIHVLIIRSKTDPTSLNRRRKRISDGQRSDAKQLGQEKTPRGFPGGWKAGLERICEYLRTRVHIEFYSLFANTGRATALLCPTRPARQLRAFRLFVWINDMFSNSASRPYAGAEGQRVGQTRGRLNKRREEIRKADHIVNIFSPT